MIKFRDPVGAKRYEAMRKQGEFDAMRARLENKPPLTILAAIGIWACVALAALSAFVIAEATPRRGSIPDLPPHYAWYGLAAFVVALLAGWLINRFWQNQAAPH